MRSPPRGSGPRLFRKVYSSVGSFTNLRGGNVYPSLVRKTEPKPIRVYMADTSGDVDNVAGSWPWANQQMASALKYMGYDVRFDWAEGYAHNSDFGGSKFPDAMKWLWRKETHTPVLDTRGDLGGDLTLLNLLIRDQSWEVVAKDLGFADALCADKAGNVYFCDMKAPSVVRIGADGTRKEICKESVSGLEFSPDGFLYGCQGAKSRVIAINPTSGEVKVVAEGVKPNDLAVTKDGFILITETAAKQVTRIDPKTGEVKVGGHGHHQAERHRAVERWRHAGRVRLRRDAHLDVPSEQGRRARRQDADDADAAADRPRRASSSSTSRRRTSRPPWATAWPSTRSAASTSRARSACRSSTRPAAPAACCRRSTTTSR